MRPDSFVDFGAIKIECLFVYLLSFLSFFLSYFLFFLILSSLLIFFLNRSVPTYLTTSSRIGPFRFRAGGHRRRPNLALAFWVHFMLWYILLWMHVCFCCVLFSFQY